MRTAWSLVLLSLGVLPCSHGASVSPTLLLTTFTSPTEEQLNPADPASTRETGGLSCVPLLPPRRGSYYVEQGTGVSVGTILVFWCRDGYQLVGSEITTCILHAGAPQWSNYLPICESITTPDDQGLHMALLVSVVSGMVILVMTASFILCCIQEHQSKKKEKLQTGRSRKRDKRQSKSGRSPSRLVKEELDWEAFPPLKIFHVSQQFEQEASPGTPKVDRGYENRGYQRSQESLMRSPPSGLNPADNQIFKNLGLQRSQTAPNPQSNHNSPANLHIFTPSYAKALCHHSSME